MVSAFFVHPDWARHGIGTKILEASEAAAAAMGFRRFEMGATLTGVPLYRARGYVEQERFEVPLVAGVSLPIVRMQLSGLQNGFLILRRIHLRRAQLELCSRPIVPETQPV